MSKKIILLLIHCLVGVLQVFIDDQVEKNDKDPEGFPLSDDYDTFVFLVSVFENMSDVLRGNLSIDEYIEMSKGA